jgi:hypothetical protein
LVLVLGEVEVVVVVVVVVVARVVTVVGLGRFVRVAHDDGAASLRRNRHHG